MSKKNRIKNAKAERAELTREVVTYSSFEQLYFNRAITPVVLNDVLQRAAAGDMYEWALFATDMEEKDPGLGSALAARKNAVKGLTWEILPASQEAADIKIAEAVAEVLDYTADFSDAIFDLSDAIAKGYSVSEIIWSYSEGQYWIDRLQHVLPWKLTFTDSAGNMYREPLLIKDIYGNELTPLPVGKFITHLNKARSGLVTRGGLLRSLAYFYLFKNYDIKSWVIYLERFGHPLRIGKYKVGASEADKSVLKSAVFRLATDSAAVMSEDTNITFERVEAVKEGGGLFKDFAKWVDEQYSKLILGHASGNEATAGRLGAETNAEELRQDLLAADAMAIEQTITHKLIAPYIAFQYGAEVAVPKFKLNYEPEEDLKAHADMLNTLSGMGMKTIPLSYLHEKFRIPQPQKGEKTLGDSSGEILRFAQNDKGAEMKATLGAEDVPSVVDVITSKAMQFETDDMTAVIQRLLDEVETLEELRDRLLETLPDISTEKLTDALEQAMILADLTGRMSGRS